MRPFIAASTLLLAGCATAPQPQPQPQSPAEPTTAAQPPTRRLLGMTAQDLVGQLGNPQLQVPEGNSLKLQFRTQRCVLDAYLYRSGTGPLRVTYIDTRTPSGGATDQAACISALEHSI
jgi:hypothetical protein